MSGKMEKGEVLTEWCRPPCPGSARVFGPRRQDLPKFSPSPARAWLSSRLRGALPTVGCLRQAPGAQQDIDEMCDIWCGLARAELEADTGSTYNRIGMPYSLVDFDPLERAARGVTRVGGLPAGPARSYMLEWTLRRLQEVEPRSKDGKWQACSAAAARRVRGWARLCPGLNLSWTRNRSEERRVHDMYIMDT